ncbi:MAG: hypothetical protein V4482_06160 [Pseudomonadota bacterium]
MIHLILFITLFLTGSHKTYGAVEYVNSALYGGPDSNRIYQEKAAIMPYFLCHNIEAIENYSFPQLLDQSIGVRHEVALNSGTSKAEQFRQMRTNPNTALVASITPMCKYKVMRDNLLKNIISLAKCNEFVELDDQLEYRYRELSVAKWLEIITKEYDEYNQLGSYINRIINGPDGEGDASMLPIDFENGWALDGNGERTLSIDKRYQVALLDAQEKSKQGIDIQSIRIGHIDLRIKGSNITTRSFMYAIDDASKADFSDVPFALLHPPVKAVNYHLALCNLYFEEARHCMGTAARIMQKIHQFSYMFAITMPVIRGSAANNEWFSKAFYLLHDLGLPAPECITKLDELAQSSLTMAQFSHALMDIRIDQLYPIIFTLEDFRKLVAPKPSVVVPVEEASVVTPVAEVGDNVVAGGEAISSVEKPLVSGDTEEV